MIHFSTLPSGLFPAEEMQEELELGLSPRDEAFFRSLKRDLDKELRQPGEQTLVSIFNYSKKKRNR